MRTLIFLFLIIVFASCDHPKKPYIEELTWPKRTVKLDNDLGVLTIRLPEEFDTFYKFNHISDYTCGDLRKYKFQNSKFPFLIDSFSLRIKDIDSNYSFTMEHTIISNDCYLGITIDTARLRGIKEAIITKTNKLNPSKNPIIEFGQIDTFAGREFLVLGYKNADIQYIDVDESKLKTANLTAYTRIKDFILYIDFTCATHNCDSFIPKMYKALKTVEINPN
ncbi:MAG: hypothetical protein ACXWEY_04765 [Bacteroidia bacterium]